jgi:hypothetical protein
MLSVATITLLSLLAASPTPTPTLGATVVPIPTASTTVAMPVRRGEAVKGWGETKREAMRDADDRAQAIADERGTCITPARLEDVTKDPDGGYIAVAYVANNSGSCP